jgi:hypothetical protein
MLIGALSSPLALFLCLSSEETEDGVQKYVGDDCLEHIGYGAYRWEGKKSVDVKG